MSLTKKERTDAEFKKLTESFEHSETVEELIRYQREMAKFMDYVTNCRLDEIRLRPVKKVDGD